MTEEQEGKNKKWNGGNGKWPKETIPIPTLHFFN